MINYQEMMYGIEEFRATKLNDDTREADRPSSGDKVTLKDFCLMVPVIDKKCRNTP